VSIAACESDCHSVTSPGFCDATARFTASREAIHWVEGGASQGLFEQVWIESRATPSQSAEITLDTRAFRDEDSGSKLGIGSSAALSAALATALFRLGGGEPCEVARRAHRRFQGGVGSGVDIATSLSGGVIRYRLGDVRPYTLDWPDGLCYSVFWSGKPSATRIKLERLGEQRVTGATQRLVESADDFARLFAAGDTGGVLDGLGAYCESLRRFDDEYALDIFGAGHGALADSAADFGVVYKPCGAGGGDIGVALAASKDSLTSFAAVARRKGFMPLETKMDPRGAVLTEEDQE
jgi:phosphomevalonate kinase